MTSNIRNFAAICALSVGVALPATAQDAATVVATVDGQDITLGHMIAMRSRLPEQYQELDDQTLFDGILEQMIQQTALSEEGGELSKQAEIVLENERRALAASDVLRQMSEEAVTDEAVQAAYDETYGAAEPVTEYNAAHILVETEEEAQAVLEEVNGGADFAEVAKEKSTGPSGPSGGDLGWFAAGAMVPVFDEAVQGMQAGDVAGPVESEFGWHVIKLNDTREQDAPSLEEVRAELEAALQQQAVGEMIESIVAEADVQRSETEIDPAMLRNDDLLTE